MRNKIIIYLFVFLCASNMTAASTFGGHALGDFETIVREPGKLIDKNVQKSPITIAFATPLKQESDYWRKSIDSFKGRMDEIGLSCSIIEFSTKVDENRKLKESVASAILADPDYLVLTPNDPSDKKIISRLLTKKRPKIIVQNLTIPDKDWSESPPFMYVGFNQPTGTRLIAEEYINRLGNDKHVEYAMLYHITDNQVSKLRGDRFNEIIGKQTDFKLVAEYFTEGKRNKSKLATMKILKKFPDISFIYACSTGIAFGVLDALKELELEGKVLVNGWGGGSRELESIMSGGLDFTVMRMNDDNGVAMAEAIRLDMENEIKEVPLIFSGEILIVRQGIQDKEVKKLHERAFRYSKKK